MGVTKIYSQSIPTHDSSLILHNIISYHIRYAVEADLGASSKDLLAPYGEGIFQKLMPADGQLETEIMPYNGETLYPDKTYQLFVIHLPGFKTVYPNGRAITNRLHAFRFDEYYLVAYNAKKDSIKYISGNFFKSAITQDFKLDNNAPESFFPYLRLRCHAMKPGNIIFNRRVETGLYFTIYSKDLNIDVEVFIRYDDHETVNITDSRLSGSITSTNIKSRIIHADSY
ncbi:hypothetical protein [Chitinophaga qingshengii]|uniref:Uncharacterized protein n=1 Tax=Chitinophaga qingshengii TaxID=1569794 RepID=A0ABR7TLF1_9BACT|nr:hypothetical protein [Chitinophaga qingshengii]MBC9931326.1 hypothetical protein [Chitinophaga qingshengii]